MSQNEMTLGSQKEWFIIVVIIIIDSLWIKLMIFGLTTEKYHFIFCHFIKLVYFPSFDWSNWHMLVNFIVKYFWFCLIIVVFLTTVNFFAFHPKKYSFSVDLYLTFIIRWTLSQLVVSFACFIMWSCSSLTLSPCVQCVCVYVWGWTRLLPVFSPLPELSRLHRVQTLWPIWPLY